jgi:hypothetical protein
MTMVIPGRPTETEYRPYFAYYIGLVPEGDILTILDRQATETQRLLATYTPAQAAWRPAPGEWNAAEIVGHLSDGERINAYRALSFARADPTPLPGVDPDGRMREAHFADRSMTDLAAEYLACRHATLTLLRGFDAAAWTRGGIVNVSPITVRALAYIIAGHEIHHVRDLARYPALADAAAQ